MSVALLLARPARRLRQGHDRARAGPSSCAATRSPTPHGARPAVARRADRHRADRLHHPRPGVGPVLEGRQARHRGRAPSRPARPSPTARRTASRSSACAATSTRRRRPPGRDGRLAARREGARAVDQGRGQGRHPGDHDQLRQRRVQQARRARPRRPARVRGGRREPASGWAAAGVRRALCVNQETGNDGLDERCRGLARRPHQGRRQRPRARRPAAGPDDVAQRRMAEALDRRRRRRHPHARPGRRGSRRSRPSAPAACRSASSSRPSTSRPTCWPPCATARSSSPSTSSRTCRATCRSCCSPSDARTSVFPGQGELIPTGPQFVTKADAAEVIRLSAEGIR